MTSLKITYNQRFEHRAYNMLLCAEKCGTSEICYKCLIEGPFEKFTVKIRANTPPKTTGNFQVYSTYSFKHNLTKSVKKYILYLFNTVKGKCMSIVYQFDCRVLYNRLQSDTFCDTKRIHFTECKYRNLQSDFPVISRDRV